MKLIKRIVALLLSACLVFGCMLSVLAEEASEDTSQEDTSQEDTTQNETEEVISPKDAEEELNYDPFGENEDSSEEEEITDVEVPTLPEEEPEVIPPVNDESLLSEMEETLLLENIGIKIPEAKQTELLKRDNASLYFALLHAEEVSPRENVTYFEDVALDNPYLKYINHGCEYGYLSGTGEKRFSPDKVVSVAEFATVILRIAGYSDYVTALGGGLQNYVLIAGRYDLLDNISTGAYDPLTNKDAVKILVNALDLPICDAKSIQNGNVEYIIGSDFSILNKNFEIEMKKGIVCATEDAALNGFDIPGEEKVTIMVDNVPFTFMVKDFDCDRFLGQRVYFYTDKSDFVLHMKPVIKINSLELGFNEFEISPDRCTVSFEDENGKIKTHNLTYDAVFIYNGKQDNFVTADEINSPNTKIELLDVDNDKVYEVALIEHYEVLVAEVLPDPIFTFGTHIDSYDFSPMYPEELVEEFEENGYYRSYVAAEWSTGRSITLDPKSPDYSVKLIMNGREIRYRDLRERDLLSICESRDGKEKTVYVSRNRFTTVIKEIDTEKSEITVEGGDTYVCSFDPSELLGENINLYIDAFGNATAYRRSSTVTPVYGYLINYGKGGSALSSKWQAKLYTMSKKRKVFDFAEKFYHNDTKTTGEDFSDYFSQTGHQLVKYMLDSEGKIKRIYTSTVPEGYSLHQEKPIFTLNEIYNGDSGNYGRYKSSVLEYEYNMVKTKRLLVITDENGNLLEDRIALVSSFKADKSPNLRVYDAQTGKIASMVVATMKDSEIETYQGLQDYFLVVEGIYGSPDGKFLRGMKRILNKPSLFEFYEGTPGLFDGLAAGDVIRIIWYEKNEDNHYVITRLHKEFTLKSKGDEEPAKTICADWEYNSGNKPITNGRISYNKQIYGTIKAMKSISNDDIEHRIYSVVVQPEGTSDPNDCYAFTFARILAGTNRVFKYNTKTGELVSHIGQSLSPGDKVFVATNYYSASFIVVYE